VDGSIVLWASPPDGQDRVEVIAGRVAVDRLQGFRLSVRPWRAIAARGDDGAWHLKSWEYTDVIDIAGNPPPMEIPKVSFTGDVGSGFTETIR
jgi:hypothetical protein